MVELITKMDGEVVDEQKGKFVLTFCGDAAGGVSGFGGKAAPIALVFAVCDIVKTVVEAVEEGGTPDDDMRKFKRIFRSAIIDALED